MESKEEEKKVYNEKFQTFRRRLKKKQEKEDFKEFADVSTLNIYNWLKSDGYFKRKNMKINYERFHKIIKAVHTRYREELEHGRDVMFGWGLGRVFVVLNRDIKQMMKIEASLCEHGITDRDLISQVTKKAERYYPTITMTKKRLYPRRHVRYMHFYPYGEIKRKVFYNYFIGNDFDCQTRQEYAKGAKCTKIKGLVGYTTDFRDV